VSWHSLILMAVADVQSFCSPQFLADLEPYSSFGFNFLRTRNESLLAGKLSTTFSSMPC